MTKKEAIARKQAWSKALVEGRVVRFFDGLTFRSYPTIEAAKAAVLTCEGAEIVVVGE